MDVALYNYSGDPRVLNKDMSHIATVTVLAITDTTSILHPRLVIATRAFNFNYAYISDWGRYYFVGDPIVIDGERVIIPLNVDYLMSHRDAVSNTQVIADRSASHGNAWIPDPVCGDEGTLQTIYRKSGTTPFNNTGSYLLTIAGK